MANKLPRDTWPAGHGENDFQCFGPGAVEDGKFEGTMIADMGCFNQDGKDSNRFYHGAVVESTKKPGKWFAYFEWGRVGASKPSFQFVEGGDQTDAQAAYEKQMHAKNDKRGQWVQHPALGRILQAKPKKDCYLVRPQATRSTGLPDAKTITHQETTKIKVAKKKTKGKKKKSAIYDRATAKLLADLDSGTVQYTRSSMADSALPTFEAITKASNILTHALTRVGQVGGSVGDQVRDKELKDLTNLIYSLIPKKKQLKEGPKSWVLSDNTITQWQQDLAAFESALQSTDLGDSIEVSPFGNLDIELQHLQSCEIGKFVKTWLPGATRNMHSYLGTMKIANVWSIKRDKDPATLKKYQDKVIKDGGLKSAEKPLHQPLRKDLDKDGRKRFRTSGTHLLIHGTRSVNVMGIMRQSLMLPKKLVGVSINGAAFGPGLYFADDWKKSAGYCSISGSYWSRGSGGVSNRKAFMFLTDTCLGNMHICSGARGFTSAPKGDHSVFAKAGRSGVQNNEFIVYNSDQVNLRYLIEFDV